MATFRDEVRCSPDEMRSPYHITEWDIPLLLLSSFHAGESARGANSGAAG